jgi:hypothetical protein
MRIMTTDDRDEIVVTHSPWLSLLILPTQLVDPTLNEEWNLMSLFNYFFLLIRECRDSFSFEDPFASLGIFGGN